MAVPFPATVALSDKEQELIDAIAKRYGISADDAATAMTQAAIAKRVKRHTGKSPAKVFNIPAKKT